MAGEVDKGPLRKVGLLEGLGVGDGQSGTEEGPWSTTCFTLAAEAFVGLPALGKCGGVLSFLEPLSHVFPPPLASYGPGSETPAIRVAGGGVGGGG